MYERVSSPSLVATGLPRGRVEQDELNRRLHVTEPGDPAPLVEQPGHALAPERIAGDLTGVDPEPDLGIRMLP